MQLVNKSMFQYNLANIQAILSIWKFSHIFEVQLLVQAIRTDFIYMYIINVLLYECLIYSKCLMNPVNLSIHY